MNSVINYVFQSAFCMLVFYGFYFSFLKKETCFQYNRGYLLFTSTLALLLPLVNLPAILGISFWQQSGLIPVIYLPETALAVEGSPKPPHGFEISLTGLLTGVYLTGVVFFLTRFIIQLLTIKRIIARNRYNMKYWKGCYLIHTQGKLPTFSFFRYLFWDNSITFTEREKSQILDHELVHIRQKHSFDIIYFEILGILFWFNPLIRFYKKSILDIHEFIADRLVVKHANDVSGYGQLIVRQLFKRMDLVIGSYFNKSQAYRRINMLKMTGQKTRMYKLLILLPLTVGLAFLMGFSTNQGPGERLSYRNLSPVLIESIGDKTYKNLLLEEKSAERPSELSRPFEKMPEIENQEKKGYRSFDDLIPANPGTRIEENIIKDEIFTIVESQPAPAKGMNSFYEYIRKNLRYPAKARRKGIEGKVFVQFVVEKDGSLNDVMVIKGIGAGCDEEARRVLENADEWMPGQQNGQPVKVRMVLPITFSLG